MASQAQKRPRRQSKLHSDSLRRKNTPEPSSLPAAATAVSEGLSDAVGGGAILAAPAATLLRSEHSTVLVRQGPWRLAISAALDATAASQQGEQDRADDDDATQTEPDTNSSSDSDASAPDDLSGSPGFGSGSDADSASAFVFASGPDTDARGFRADELADGSGLADSPSLSYSGPQLYGDEPPDAVNDYAGVLRERAPDEGVARQLSDAQPWRCVFLGPRPGARCDTRAAKEILTLGIMSLCAFGHDSKAECRAGHSLNELSEPLCSHNNR